MIQNTTPTKTAWNPNTLKRERPSFDIPWETPLLNGDIQVIYEVDDMSIPNPYYPYPDPRIRFPQCYYLGMFNEGQFEAMSQHLYDFDVRRHLHGFQRIEQVQPESEDDTLIGLFRKEGIDQRPLFQRGYSSVFLSYEQYCQQCEGSQTKEWRRGSKAGHADKWLKEEHLVDTNSSRYHPCSLEPLEKVQYLL